nr:uncharacterized protein LOC119168836 [Rhipicephalus microplus]
MAMQQEAMSWEAVPDNVGMNVEVAMQCQSTIDEHQHPEVDDHVSVQLWVESMHLRRDNPVLFFKNRGQPDRPDVLDRLPKALLKERDFMLVIMTAPQLQLLRKFGINCVCVDSICGTTAFSYQLVTLLSVEEFGASFPVAYCITNRTDEKGMAIFFESVRSKTGRISVDIFITHDASSFYNAWTEVMGCPEHRVLCTWHVRKTWRQTLNQHTQNKKLKASVYREFQKVMDNPYERVFQLDLKNFLAWCDLKAETQPAIRDIKHQVEYNYAYHRNAWAAYFRRTAGVDASMRHDAVHMILTHCYSHKTTNKRMDRLISVLLKLTRSKIFALLPRVIRRSKDRFDQDTEIRHKRGLDISRRDIHKVASKQWCICSQAGHGLEYIVTQWAPCRERCRKACPDCRVCIHMASCTCPDHMSRNTICKHIHAVFKPNDSDTSHLSDRSDVPHVENMVPAYYGDWDDEEGVEDMIEDIEELEKEDCTDDRDCVTMLEEIMGHLVAAPMVEDQATPWLRPALSNILAKLERISPPSKTDTSVMSSSSSSHALSDSSSDKSEEQYHCCSPKSKTFDMRLQAAELYSPEQASVSDTSQSDTEEQVHHTGFDHGYCRYGTRCFTTMQ